MPEAFKLRFNAPLVELMARHIKRASQRLSPNDSAKHFDAERFIDAATFGLDALELKARSNQIKDALLTHMPSDFILSARIISLALGPASKADNTAFESHPHGLSGWMMMPVTDYVTQASLLHNKQYLAQAFDLIHACTQRFSAEFSIRPFLRDHTQETLLVFHQWAKDDNVHVRRLVSEGCRPYLPWGLRLHAFAQNPSLILPLLEILKDDPSLYVRRSVANNLNDIAKTHPELVASIAKSWWDAESLNRARLIKHACRTLLKNGDPQVLALFGYAPATQLKVTLTLKHKHVLMGTSQIIELWVSNDSCESQNLLVDYAMLHQKANGKMLPKMFKWTSLTIAAHSQITLSKKHSFKPVTTRKYYQGQHGVEIFINGEVFAKEAFELCV